MLLLVPLRNHSLLIMLSITAVILNIINIEYIIKHVFQK